MAAAVAVTPGKEDGHISKTSGKLASPDGVDQFLDIEEFEAAPSTHKVPTCSLNSFERTAKSRLDEILSEDEDDRSPLTDADRIRLAAILAEPDDDSLTRYSNVPGLAEPKDPLRPKTRDQLFLCVKAITSAIPTYADLILNPPPEPEAGPELVYVADEDRIQGYDFKCYYQDSNPDPASSPTVFRMTIYEEVLDGGGGGEGGDAVGGDDEDIVEGLWSEDEDERETYFCTLLPRDHASQPSGPSELMDVLLIDPPIGVPLKPWNNEEQTLWEVRTWYLGKSFDREQLLRRVGYDRFFDGGLIWKGAAGFELMFQRRSVFDIIKGLRDYGMRRGADYLENSALKSQRELEGRIQKELKEKRWAAFGRVVDIVLRLNPDKPRPTISLEDSFLWLLDRRYLGRWWASCRDDLGLDDKVVYKPEGEPVGEPDRHLPKKKQTGRSTRGGSRRHGRPPGPTSPTAMPPLSAIASEDPSTLSAGVSVHSAAGASVTGFVFIVFTVDSAPGPVTPTAMRDDASLKSPALHAPKLS